MFLIISAEAAELWAVPSSVVGFLEKARKSKPFFVNYVVLFPIPCCKVKCSVTALYPKIIYLVY